MLTLGAALLGAALSSAEAPTPPPADHASDPWRTAMVATSWSLVGVNATLTPLAVFAEGMNQFANPRSTKDVRAPWLSTLPMVFTPSLPRWAVGDFKGALLFTGLRAASWGTAALLRGSTHDHLPMFVTAYAIPLALSVVDLVTAPHREDLGPPKGPALQGLGPSPLLDGTGVHGMTLTAAGVF